MVRNDPIEKAFGILKACSTEQAGHRRELEEKLMSLQSHPKRWGPRVAACIAALMALVALAGPWMSAYFGGTVAYADTVAEINSARSVRFDAVVSSPSQNMPDEKMTTTIASPHLRRDETSERVFINDARQGKWLMLDKNDKKAELGTNRRMTGVDLFGEVVSVDVEKGKRLSSKVVDGHKCVGFEFRSVENKLVSTKTVWVDEETKLPVRIELVYSSDAVELHAKQVLTNFVFDDAVDESQFSLEPPQGYELSTPDGGDSFVPLDEANSETSD